MVKPRDVGAVALGLLLSWVLLVFGVRYGILEFPRGLFAVGAFALVSFGGSMATGLCMQRITLTVPFGILFAPGLYWAGFLVFGNIGETLRLGLVWMLFNGILIVATSFLGVKAGVHMRTKRKLTRNELAGNGSGGSMRKRKYLIIGGILLIAAFVLVVVVPPALKTEAYKVAPGGGRDAHTRTEQESLVTTATTVKYIGYGAAVFGAIFLLLSFAGPATAGPPTGSRCAKCGHVTPGEARFCSNCGNDL